MLSTECTCADPNVCNHNFITNLKFNQDSSCFGVCTKMGFLVYDTEPVRKRYFTITSSKVHSVDIHYRTNIIMYIQGDGKQLCVWDQFKSEKVANLQFRDPILGVTHTHECIVVVLPDIIYVYTTVNIQEIAQFQAVSKNGCVALYSCVHTGNILIHLAHPGVTEGEVIIETINQMSDTNVSIVSGSYLPNGSVESKTITKTSQTFQAHINDIQFLTFNSDATVLATVSVKGTLIRLWDVARCDRIAEFRRGSDPAKVTGMRFNKTNNQLLVTSNKGTIHIFSTDPAVNRANSGYLSWILPGYFNSVWSCRKINVPTTSLNNCIATFVETGNNNETGIVAVCYDGYVYKFILTVDPVSLVESCVQVELNLHTDIAMLYKIR